VWIQPSQDVWLRRDGVCVAGSVVAGTDTSLVSRIAVDGGLRCVEHCNTLGVLGATLSIPYDSLIEKCSTLSRLCAAQGWSAFFSPKLSV
jgi:hypothetical protein